MNFVFFAITSPLKSEAFASNKPCDSLLKKLASLNTLILHKGRYFGYNTDRAGLQACLKKYKPSQPIKVWGAGSLHNLLKMEMPEACFYSARTGKLLHGSESKDVQTLIWLVGRHRMKSCLWPPKTLAPKEVIDLNYVDNSPGKEYAIKQGIKYTSGWFFFKEQAREQREIFKELESK